MAKAKARGLPSSKDRASTGLMRAVAVVSDRLVAVVASNTEASGIAMSLEPAMQSRAGIPLSLSPSIDVIEGQELNVVIATTRASRVAIAVVHQCGHAIALLCSPAFRSLSFGILPHELPSRKYLAALACPLETLARWASGIAVKVVSRKGQLFPTYRTDACRGCRQAHWCNPLIRSVTPIMAEWEQGVKGEGLLAQGGVTFREPVWPCVPFRFPPVAPKRNIAQGRALEHPIEPLP